MKLQDFEYDLPRELIAQRPLERRDQARLMVIDRKNQKISHDIFARVADYLPKESVLVLNDSKVIAARLFGKREATGGKVEIFLLNRLSDGVSFEALIHPLKKLKIGEKIIFNNNGIFARLKDAQKKIVRFNKRNIFEHLEEIGHVPLPPYIKRADDFSDREYYQTVYADREGSVASPTAGLHFTKELLSALKDAGHGILTVTLHINYATFRPVKENDITRHHMHFESYSVSKKIFDAIKKARDQKKKIVAVGTSSCRTLEAAAQTGKLKGKTNLFIYPGFQFQMADILLTNFHTPASTLLMLVSAFAGQDFIKKAYREAIEKRYRFFSYGDAMLIL